MYQAEMFKNWVSFTIFLLAVISGKASLLHRFAVGSCSNPNRGGKIWRMIDSYTPDHLVLLGDVVYADYEAMGKVTPELPGKIDREFAILSRDKHWNKLRASVPHWSITYDDHDYGCNNGDKTFLYRNFSQNAFRAFAKDSYEGFDSHATNGVYSSKLIEVPTANGGTLTYKLIMLDTRSNKDPKATPDGDFLGEEQWAWLTAELSDTSPDLILLGSSIQVLSDDKIVEESWSEFPLMRARILKLVTAASLRTNVVLLTGDVHRAEVSHAKCTFTANNEDLQIKTDVWDLTSSGLAHTLRYVTDDVALTSREDYEDNDSAPFTVPVKSRNFVLEGADIIYQVSHKDSFCGYYSCASSSQRFFPSLSFLLFLQFAYPGYFRENGHADAFSNVHFALLDIVTTEDTATGLQLEFKVISHANKEVIRKVLPLRTKQELFEAHSAEGTTQMQFDEAVRLIGSGDETVQVLCEPHWGFVPLWREVWYRAVVALAMMFFLVLPALAIMWYVGAAVYYIVRGAELVRRDELEQRYREHKKST